MYEGRESMIHVFDDYYIDADEYQYILKQDMHRKDKRKKNDGSVEEYDAYKVISYHKTISSAISAIIAENYREIASDKNVELREFLSLVNDTDERMIDVMRKTIPESEW